MQPFPIQQLCKPRGTRRFRLGMRVLISKEGKMREANFSRVCKIEPDARVVEAEVSNRENGGAEE